MGKLGSILAVIAALGAALGLYGAGRKAGADACEAQHLAKLAAAQREAARLSDLRGQITADVDRLHQEKAEQIRVVYRTIYREIPNALTPETDARYPLPHGLVRLHDAAALGVPPVPDPSGIPDDEPSPVAASQLAGVIVDNYENCNSALARLVALQGWVRSQAAVDSSGASGEPEMSTPYQQPIP